MAKKEKEKCCEDKSEWAIGGGMMMGLGVGFFFFSMYAEDFFR